MSNNRIVEHLVKQFDSSWKMLRQAIEKVPDEKWTDAVQAIKKPWSETRGMNVWYFSDRVYHIIQTVEFYTNDNPDEMTWGGRIGGINWKEESPDATASRIKKNDMLEYLEDTKQNLEKKLKTFTGDDLFEKDGFSEWQSSRLAKFLYTMRHSMWHIGELSKAMRDFEGDRLQWQ